MPSSSSSAEKKLLRGSLLPSFALGLICVIVSAILRGKSGIIGALLAQLVVVAFFIVHIGVSAISRKLDPLSTFALAIFSYFAKIAVLGLFLWALTNFTSRETINRASFGLTSIALTITWLAGEIRSFLNLRLHLPLPNEPRNNP
ncbi:unannotated protein [freshwater metagenome]|jgi:hypothetical protein|uniref:Unannotated protein n=1 Tax=freshwater metagenome TaxID=449393 RepID=A0A6J6Y325_9ZZZZ|nr:hypothetical protein [Actinomycetota bacterium]MSV86928.1 hypothetical protein [Actinomycetota bacterium]MSW68105.1 hypothetical protein [Actinomycetota bacterium]MSX27897.1 hypothetical protein [Actinomycetota bacterium]MSY03548.1 hypothetical protein [Actinomycetota bacterium]